MFHSCYPPGQCCTGVLCLIGCCQPAPSALFHSTDVPASLLYTHQTVFRRGCVRPVDRLSPCTIREYKRLGRQEQPYRRPTQRAPVFH